MANTKKRGPGVYNINLTVASKVLWIAIMVLGVLSTLCILAPALVSQTDDVHTGLQVTFGETWYKTDFVSQYIPFSILAFMGFFFR